MKKPNFNYLLDCMKTARQDANAISNVPLDVDIEHMMDDICETICYYMVAHGVDGARPFSRAFADMLIDSTFYTLFIDEVIDDRSIVDSNHHKYIFMRIYDSWLSLIASACQIADSEHESRIENRLRVDFPDRSNL